MLPSDQEIANTLRRLRGQFCTPPGIGREAIRVVQDAGFAQFREWPSGHWHITERGNEWLAENE